MPLLSSPMQQEYWPYSLSNSAWHFSSLSFLFKTNYFHCITASALSFLRSIYITLGLKFHQGNCKTCIQRISGPLASATLVLPRLIPTLFPVTPLSDMSKSGLIASNFEGTNGSLLAKRSLHAWDPAPQTPCNWYLHSYKVSCVFSAKNGRTVNNNSRFVFYNYNTTAMPISQLNRRENQSTDSSP